MDLFNSTFIIKKQTVIHLMCKYNHIHLFESLQRLKESVDINLFNENGESPLMIALNEKSTLMVDKILKEF
jgi:ankyrin repeat protein